MYKFTSSFHRTMFLWMFIFIYTSFITSYNQEFITFSRLFTGWRLLTTTTDTPPHFEAGGAVSVPFMQQAYTIFLFLLTKIYCICLMMILHQLKSKIITMYQPYRFRNHASLQYENIELSIKMICWNIPTCTQKPGTRRI